MHYIFIPPFITPYLIIRLHYDSTNTFAEMDADYSHMQLQTPWLCVDFALSRRQCMFYVN